MRELEEVPGPKLQSGPDLAGPALAIATLSVSLSQSLLLPPSLSVALSSKITSLLKTF